MKKIVGLGLVLFCGIVLGACGGASDNDESNVTSSMQSSSNHLKASATTQSSTIIDSSTVSSIPTIESSISESQTETTFKNGKLTTPGFILTIDKTQVGHDNSADEDGLIIWYTVENLSDRTFVPDDLLLNFYITQRDETSIYDIPTDYNGFDSAEALYPMYNSDGSSIEDIDKYNEAIRNQNEFNDEFEKKSYAELLPGAKVQVATGLMLHNTDYPVSIKLQDFVLDEGQNNDEEYIIDINSNI